MDRRSLGLAPPSPRPTMRALLITACLFAAVPSAEAVSLPSISSSAGIAMAVVSVALALSLLIGMAFNDKVKRLASKVGTALGLTNRPKQENVETGQSTEIAGTGTPIENAAARRSTESGLQGNEETGQPTEIIPPQPISLVIDPSFPVAPNPFQENKKREFLDFIQDWNEHSLQDKDEFIVDMVKGFPDAVTPSMVMELLLTMLREEVNTDVWMRMLHFIMMLERHLFKWDKRKLTIFRGVEFEIETPIPHQTHQRFQEFLIKHARKILTRCGDRKGRYYEGPEAGFMRFIAFLFGFVCKDRRILELMDRTWYLDGFKQEDASRAMVWGYKNWKETRVPGRTTDTESDNNNPNFDHFHNLMDELKYESTRRPDPNPGLNPDPWFEPDVNVGSRAQHLLFALGCGYEPDPAEGPLAYMCDEEADVTTPYTGKDYLWLMTGRDLMAGNAWEWMCKEGMSEHDRMVRRFYRDDASDDGLLYKHIVDMVTKYEQDHSYNMKDGKHLLFYAIRMRMVRGINFGEYQDWYDRFEGEKWSVGVGINDWLIKNKNIHRPPLQYNVEDE